VNNVEAFEKAQRGDGGVKIEAGRETGSEGEGDDLERIHGGLIFSLTVAMAVDKGIARTEGRKQISLRRHSA